MSFALIGVGGVGAYHLAGIRRLQEHGKARLTAVVEPHVARFPDLKRELDALGVRWHLNYQDLLREEAELQAVTIATPIPFHFEMTRACLERDLFINLEKPPVPLVQQLEALIAADRNRRVTVGFQMTMSRCAQRLKQLVLDDSIGELRHLRAAGCWPRLDEYYARASWAGRLLLGDLPVFDGPATNALAHLVHHLMFIAGATQAGFAVPEEVRGEMYRARPIESYDVACMRGVFASGADFSVAVTHATREAMPFKLEVQGTAGWARLTHDGARLETSAGETLDHPESTQALLDVCYDRFAETVAQRSDRTYTSLADTAGYVRSTNALYLSSGGIRDLNPEAVRRYGENEKGGYEVDGLFAAVEESFASGRLFSELGTGWAVAQPAAVRLDSFQTLRLDPPATTPRA